MEFNNVPFLGFSAHAKGQKKVFVSSVVDAVSGFILNVKIYQAVMRWGTSKGEAARDESASEATHLADSSLAASPLLVPQRMRAC